MSKFSVKKPLTVFVAVLAVIVLGVVAFLKMTPDLLPNMDFPYIVIMTTYPGASPEKVEAEVTKPLEQSMSTLEHIKEVTSTSSENYSMVMLEFVEDTDLDVIGVDIQQQISALQGSWDDLVGAPYVLKINPSLLPVMVAAVSMKGQDTVELTQLLEDGLANKLEGIAGVARVSISGTVTQQLHVVLDDKMLENTNKNLAAAIEKELDSSLKELEKGKKELLSAKKKLKDGKKQLEEGKTSLIDKTSTGNAELNQQLTQLLTAKGQLENSLSGLKSVQSGLKTLKDQEAVLQKQVTALEALQAFVLDVQMRKAAMDQRLETEGESVKQTPEYVQLQADIAAMQAKLTAFQATPETLPTMLGGAKAGLKKVQDAIADLEKKVQEQGIKPKELDSTITKLEDQLAQLEQGIATIKTSQKELNTAQMDGLLQISKSATDIALGQENISNALEQVEQGFTAAEQAREQALKQADVTKILTMDMVSQILTAQNFSMPAGTVEENGVRFTDMAERMENGAWRLPCGSYCFGAK